MELYIKIIKTYPIFDNYPYTGYNKGQGGDRVYILKLLAVRLIYYNMVINYKRRIPIWMNIFDYGKAFKK